MFYFKKDDYPSEWASIKAGIGQSYAEMKDRESILNISKAIENYIETIYVFTKEDYPEDYKDSMQELCYLKRRLDDDKKWDTLLQKIISKQ